jgi:hypothetical protein
MNLDVKTTWLENESTRSAYYQVFQITPGVGRIITVTHYGPLCTTTSSVSTWHRPVNSGKTKVERGALLSAKVIAKVNRRYNIMDTKQEAIIDGDRWMVETFGAALATEIGIEMTFSGPRSAPDNTVIEKAIEPDEPRPAMWGVW